MSRATRPFWLHQVVEYVVGLVSVAVGLQSPTPVVPSVYGLLVLCWASVTRGPLSAFHLVPRRAHRVGDPVLVAVGVAAAAQPWMSIDSGTRLVMVGLAVVYAVVWRQSSFAGAVRSPTSGDRATDLGRSAGRLAGSGVNAVRRARAQRGSSDGR